MKNNDYLKQYFTLIVSNQIQNEKIRWIYQSDSYIKNKYGIK